MAHCGHAPTVAYTLASLTPRPAVHACWAHCRTELPYTPFPCAHPQVNTLELTPEGYIDYQRKVNLFLNK